MLRVVDVSDAQAGIDASALDCDAVIVKVTGGDYYTNPYWREQVESALAGGKHIGLYHYARDLHGGYATPEAEARRFLDAIQPYVGRCVVALDWEREADAYPISWAREWCEIVGRETGATPLFYAGALDINGRDFSEVAKYPLWMASYLYRYEHVGWVEDPDNTYGTGAWDGMLMYQYTSTGRIGGYGGNLDLSVFYGSAEDWRRLEGGGMEVLRLNEVAAAIHRRMVDDDRFGYSWEERYGAIPETWDVMGKSVTIDVGDYECGTSVKTAWALALQGTPYEGCLDGYVYSMNAKETFLGSGLFEWHEDVSIADVGDIYLNEENHLAMCQGGGMLSEFCWGDNGAYGNQRGDQSGQEAYYHGFYDYSPGGWDGCLHYNGKADIFINSREDEDMQFIYKPDGKDFLVYHNGSANIRFMSEDAKDAVVEAYKKATGRDIPIFEFGTKEAPLAARFEQCFPYYLSGKYEDLDDGPKLVKR